MNQVVPTFFSSPFSAKQLASWGRMWFNFLVYFGTHTNPGATFFVITLRVETFCTWNWSWGEIRAWTWRLPPRSGTGSWGCLRRPWSGKSGGEAARKDPVKSNSIRWVIWFCGNCSKSVRSILPEGCELLNKRSELMSKCRHQAKFTLKRVKEDGEEEDENT